MEGYFVVQTQPRREEFAARELRNQDFEVFTPVLKKRLRILRRGKLIAPVVPLFPRYIFCRFDPELDHWQPINGTRGVTRVLCSNKQNPLRVPDDFMAFLLAKGGIFEEEPLPSKFWPGDNVEMTHDSFKGHIGRVQSATEKRVDILISLLGRETLISVSSESVRLAHKPNAALVR